MCEPEPNLKLEGAAWWTACQGECGPPSVAGDWQWDLISLTSEERGFVGTQKDKMDARGTKWEGESVTFTRLKRQTEYTCRLGCRLGTIGIRKYWNHMQSHTLSGGQTRVGLRLLETS